MTLDVARQTGDVEQSTSTSGFTDAVIANLGRAPATRYPARPAAPPRDAAAPAPALGDAGRSRASDARVVGRRRLRRGAIEDRPTLGQRSTAWPARTSGSSSSRRAAPWSTRPRRPCRHRRLVALPVRGRRGRTAGRTMPRCCGSWSASARGCLDARPEAARLRRRGGLHPRPGPVGSPGLRPLRPSGMPDRRQDRIRDARSQPLRVKPGQRVRLPKDFDPGYTGPLVQKSEADRVPGRGREAALRVPDASGRPGHLWPARHLPGDGRGGQGRHDPPRHERGQPAGRAGLELQCPVGGGARPRLPLARDARACRRAA